jgi:hypothetical protein
LGGLFSQTKNANFPRVLCFHVLQQGFDLFSPKLKYRRDSKHNENKRNRDNFPSVIENIIQQGFD